MDKSTCEKLAIKYICNTFDFANKSPEEFANCYKDVLKKIENSTESKFTGAINS